MKIIISMLMGMVLMIPSVIADSIFSNPAFDTVLLLIFAAVVFVVIKQAIGMINSSK